MRRDFHYWWLFLDVLSGPAGAVAACEDLREQMRWAVGRVLLENANVINDESVVFKDYGGDDWPVSLDRIGPNPTCNYGARLRCAVPLDRVELDRKGSVFERLFVNCVYKEGSRALVFAGEEIAYHPCWF